VSLESENREQHRKQQNGIREDQSGQPHRRNGWYLTIIYLNFHFTNSETKTNKYCKFNSFLFVDVCWIG
jgi:hypothetical protein